MKQFGIRHSPRKNLRYYLHFLDIPFLVIILCTFAVFSFYHNVTSIVFSHNKIDVFTEDLQQIALYFWTIDRNFSEFLITVDGVVTQYMQGDNILVTQTIPIEKARSYISDNKNYLKGLGFDNYTTVIDFLADTWKYKEELFTLLGKNEPQYYLVMLQNSNEKRPNGGFFGSFAFIKVSQARIEELKIVDAYYPDYIAKHTSLKAPEWAHSFLPENKIAFIAANKFGFTDMDGKNIKMLYERMFNETYSTEKLKEVMNPAFYEGLLHKNIKGVIFIQSDLLEFLLPGFTQQIWEWQFVNASIDLIRGENRGNKKEQYISEVNNFFTQNQGTIVKNFINRLPEVLAQNLIHIYVSNTTDLFNGLLQKWGLTNVYDPHFIYARDTNDSYNKVDNFIQKKIQILNSNNEIIIDTMVDKIDIHSLKKGDYTLKIMYALLIPEHYTQYIAQLETKYGISLGDREKTILAVAVNTGIDKNQGLRWRSRSTIYLPPQAILGSIEGNGISTELFDAPFARGVFYAMKMEKNPSNKTISVHFTLP